MGWVTLGLVIGLPARSSSCSRGGRSSFDYPAARPLQHRGRHGESSPSSWRCCSAWSIYTGAFITEVVRAGILAVSRGQTEAAFALGLKPNHDAS